jgi:hypothetical protein
MTTMERLGQHENRHREERSDAAIQGDDRCSTSAWIASP